ncbi:hypothetical protein FV218_21335 [Methylobacterium sp. WL69]|uniref:hypothetical protein n=1 Tax=Methylobacterium sp. WL69 TaxID=2603893 RepID=UPI0011C8404B|nr:hypothetical protein [Methylobacterium sp. WL69]TXM65434.1 hypothetical protein FV218_21335 [Methylobacterium sp. WL69]
MPARWSLRPPATIEECHVAFAAAFAKSTYGTGIRRWAAYVDDDMRKAFEGDLGLVLTRDAIVPRYHAVMALKFDQLSERKVPDRRAWEGAGNAIGWGVRLGILHEARSETDEPTWRLVRAEPTWVIDTARGGCCLVQVGGLTPEAKTARARKVATQAKLTRTLARKACLEATPSIASCLAAIMETWPDYDVPEAWTEQGFVPGWTAGVALGACFDAVKEGHIAAELSKVQLHSWRVVLNAEVVRAKAHLRERRRRKMEGLLAGAEESEPSIPAEDLASIDALSR